MGTIVALHVVAAAAVDAQESRIRAERVAIVDGNGAERAIMRSEGVDLLSSAGIRRITMDVGSQAAPGGTSDAARLQVFAPERGGAEGRPPIAVFGTDSGGEGSLLQLRDRHQQIRIALRVDRDGNASIEMRDADGNVTWRAQ